MDLSKIEVKPEDIVPDIKFYGETNLDIEQLNNVEDVRNIAMEAIYRLGAAATMSKDWNEASVKDIHNASVKSIKDIKEYLGDYE